MSDPSEDDEWGQLEANVEDDALSSASGGGWGGMAATPVPSLASEEPDKGSDEDAEWAELEARRDDEDGQVPSITAADMLAECMEGNIQRRGRRNAYDVEATAALHRRQQEVRKAKSARTSVSMSDIPVASTATLSRMREDYVPIYSTIPLAKVVHDALEIYK